MKTLALCAILKNERHNLEQFLSSFHGCVDHVYLCDTGSTDGSIEWIEENAAFVAGCPVSLTHFEWVGDFSKARNFCKKHVKEDYWMWADLDDVLGAPDFFKAWKKSAMHLSDVWFAPYHYGFDDQGVAVTKFIRERVFKTALGLDFSDFVHEGVRPKETHVINGVQTWRMDHKRTAEEAIQDRGRNLDLLMHNYASLSPRLHVYLGKEFFDNGKMKEATEELSKCLKYPESVLDMGDKIMGVQYLAMAHLNLGHHDDCIRYCQIGTHLDPLRAEFFCMLGDSYFASNRLHQAIPWYRAATGCFNHASNGMGKLFSFEMMYDQYPKSQLAKIYFNIGEFDLSRIEAEQVDSEDMKEILSRIKDIKAATPALGKNKTIDCDDVVFTCLSSAYPWDYEVYKEKGIGGSETACVEMAEELARKTQCQIKIFNQRKTRYVSPSGVEYLPLEGMLGYFSKWKPRMHIAWRHTQKITDAPTYTWSHDLLTPGAENQNAFGKIICLSQFHSEYMQAMQGVDPDKIWISRNGLNLERFRDIPVALKEGNRVIWPNSPDRGLEYAMHVMDKVRESVPDAELHVFYGMENLKKYGMHDLANRLELMMQTRPWVKYHGNVEQRVLAQELAKSSVWLYTANFIETFCITALEALACCAYPVVRRIGALADTLKEASEKHMCDLLDYDTRPEDVRLWADHVVEALRLKKWQNMAYDIKKHSWSSVAKEWTKEMGLIDADKSMHRLG